MWLSFWNVLPHISWWIHTLHLAFGFYLLKAPLPYRACEWPFFALLSSTLNWFGDEASSSSFFFVFLHSCAKNHYTHITHLTVTSSRAIKPLPQAHRILDWSLNQSFACSRGWKILGSPPCPTGVCCRSSGTAFRSSDDAVIKRISKTASIVQKRQCISIGWSSCDPVNTGAHVNTRRHQITSHVNSWPGIFIWNHFNQNDNKCSCNCGVFMC